MHSIQWPLVAVFFLVFLLPVQLGAQEDEPVPASEVIGVLVQFVAGDFGSLEFVGDVRLQNLSPDVCFVTLRFGEGAGQLPSVTLLANGDPVEEGSLSFSVDREHILEITTAEPDQLFRGSVLAHSNDHGCAGAVSLQGGYEIQSSGASAQGAGGEIIEIASIRPGSLLTEEKCVAAPLPVGSMGGVAWVGGLPFTRLFPAEFSTKLRISVLGDLGELQGSISHTEFPAAGVFRARTEEELFAAADTSAFGNHRLRVCLSDSFPGESVYVQLGEFQTDRTGNVQTAQPFADRIFPCQSSHSNLCLSQHRFQVRASWSTQTEGDTGVARQLGGSSGAFDFSNDENPEFDAIVQVIDACEQAGHYWVTVASTSTAQFTIDVTDLIAEQSQEYTNPLGNEFQPVFDAETFANCP